MTIRAIVSDLDDTLWELRPVMERAERELRDFARREFPELAALLSDRQELMQLRGQLLHEQPQLRCDLSLWRLKLYRALAQRAGLSGQGAETAAQQLFEVYFHWRNRVDFFPGALEVLRQLSADFRLGTLTNGNAALDRVGIADVFDFSLSSRDVGIPKPEPDIFIEATRLAQCAAEEILYLGDDPVLDVEASRRVGMQPLWFNPTGEQWSGEGEAPPQLRCWKELPQFLRR